MVPAVMWKGHDKLLILIFVPLNALIRDLLNRFSEAGIQAAIWDSHQPEPTTPVVLANYSALKADRMQAWVKQQIQIKRLWLIGVDEMDYKYDAEEYRPELAKLAQLYTYGVPMVLLTATCPPSITTPILTSLGIDRTRVREIRARTTRPNIFYEVVKVEKNRSASAEEVTMEMIKERMKLMTGTGLGMLYRNDIKKLEKL